MCFFHIVQYWVCLIHLDFSLPHPTISPINIDSSDLHQAAPVTSSTAQGGGGSFKNRKPIGEVGCCESGMAERSH